MCCQDDTALDGDDCNGDDGGYYILVRRAEELMPPSCLFDKLDRAEADRCVCGCVSTTVHCTCTVENVQHNVCVVCPQVTSC